MSSMELSEEYEVRQKTCWEYKWKIQQAMKSSGNYPLTGTVHVDEFYIGGEEDDRQGRHPKSKKKLVVVALEVLSDTDKADVGRAYAQVIENASSASFRPFFERYISKQAHVVTDEWRGYIPLAKDYDIEQRKSEGGSSFPQMHIHIMNIKGKSIIIALNRGFKDTWMSTISATIGVTIWRQSSIYSFEGWSIIIQYA